MWESNPGAVAAECDRGSWWDGLEPVEPDPLDPEHPAFAGQPHPLIRVVAEHGPIDFDATLARLLAGQPGPAMQAATTIIAGYSATLTPDQRVDLMIVLERCSAW